MWIKNTLFVTKGKSIYRLIDISTGAKTCMLVYHLPKREGYVIDLSHCGENALISLFSHINKSNTPLYLPNQPLKAQHKELDGIVFNINNKRKGTYFDLWNAMIKGE